MYIYIYSVYSKPSSLMKTFYTSLFIVLTLLCSVTTIAQTVFRGTVIDADTKQPIAEARVGINNQGIGEITNTKGFFNYRKYHEVLNSESKLIVGAKGYESLQLDSEKVRTLFNISSKIELQPSSKKQKVKTIKEVTVFWDVSKDMRDRDTEAEIAYVQNYVSAYKQITLRLVVFDNKVRSEERISIKNGDITRFRESVSSPIYNGSSNYDVLDIARTDAVILSSNGMPLFGTLDVNQKIPVNVIVSQKVNNDAQYLDRLVAYTSGKFNVLNSTGLVSNEQGTLLSAKRELIKETNDKGQLTVLPNKNLDYKSVVEGKVVGPQGPIQGASIIKKGSLDEYTSKADGRFTIPASLGDQIHVSYLGMHTAGFMVNDLKTPKDIELIPKNDILKEVKLTGKKREEDELITTGTGKVSRDSYGFASHYLGSKDIPAGKNSLLDILNGRFSGVRVTGISGAFINIGTFRGRTEPPVVVIDGVIFSQSGNVSPISGGIPDVNAQDIESITILKGLGSTSSYGAVASGGAVIIELKSGIDKEKPSTKSLEVQGNDYLEELNSLEFDEDISTQISGTITGPQGPIQGASIIKKGSFDEYTSDANGSFTIPAKKGDAIVFSYLGMYPKGELIQDVDAKLLINLIPRNELLEEVVLEGNSKEKEVVETAYGKEDKDKVGYAINSLQGKDIKPQYQFLSDVLRGQFAGIQVLGQGNDVKLIVRQSGLTFGGTNDDGEPLYVVDNSLISGRSLSEMNSIIDVDNIKKITILKSYASTNIYGSLAVDGAVIIKTKTGNSTFSKENKAASLLVKGNDYQESDLQNADDIVELPSYIKQIQQIPAIETRFEKYIALKAAYETDIEFYVDMALYFKKYDSQKAKIILSDLTLRGKNNVKVLRTVAYIYESLKEYEQAQNVYERILKLEPSAAQSYRDVAMIYQYTGAYEKALELYVNMLGEQIKGVDFSGLEKPLISELSRLIARHKDKIDYERLPNQWFRSDFNIDVRMVIDWSDRSVPFEFQFVNPNKKYYKWTHDLEKNQARLEAEQKQGFQTEEFIIDDAPSGEWLVNIQYLGLEEDYVLPPFMKYTIYKNFGTAEETRDVRVVKLFRQLNKVTLGKIVL